MTIPRRDVCVCVCRVRAMHCPSDASRAKNELLQFIECAFSKWHIKMSSNFARDGKWNHPIVTVDPMPFNLNQELK